MLKKLFLCCCMIGTAQSVLSMESDDVERPVSHYVYNVIKSLCKLYSAPKEAHTWQYYIATDHEEQKEPNVLYWIEYEAKPTPKIIFSKKLHEKIQRESCFDSDNSLHTNSYIDFCLLKAISQIKLKHSMESLNNDVVSHYGDIIAVQCLNNEKLSSLQDIIAHDDALTGVINTEVYNKHKKTCDRNCKEHVRFLHGLILHADPTELKEIRNALSTPFSVSFNAIEKEILKDIAPKVA
jgi:hypothetical protein